MRYTTRYAPSFSRRERILVCFIPLFLYLFFLSFFGLASQQNKDDTQYDERD